MGSLLSRNALALAAALAATAAFAEGDRNELFLGMSAGYVGTSTDLLDWPDGGVSKLRYSDDGVDSARVFAEYRGRITPTLGARIVADIVADGSAGLDLTEAFIDWRPIPTSRNQQQLRFGAFYPPFSLENTERGWQSPFTYSYSAINTWLGEEIRPLGVEWSWRRRLERGAHELRAFAAGFYGNDPAATLLFWRGWSLHDRQSRLNDKLTIPSLPVFDGGGNVVGSLPQPLQPFTETDHRPGAYAGIEWRYAHRVSVQLARYDNRADPWSFAGTQWGWRTAFDHLGVQAALPGDVGLIGQVMWGNTDWVSGARPDGTTAPNPRIVTDDFEAWFVLLTRKWQGAHRVALRYDGFYTDRPAAVPELVSDEGHAWTVSYRYEPRARFAAGIEWLMVSSGRDLWPYFYGAPRQAEERQVRLEFSLYVGAAARR
jgi:hypothetical protein